MGAAPMVPTVSVAVLNHRRPTLLRRVLTAVSQLDYPAFEIVVVGDQPTLGSYDLSDLLASQIKYVHFAEPNICRARNHAVRASGGEIVAFIDDDAVPEPDWLTEIVSPFSDPTVATAGGAVRASDGISIEWLGGLFDRTGHETAVPLTHDITTQSAAEQHGNGQYLSLRGVNSAFRRKAVLAVGGFDEAIQYYLDETDIALRLADTGWSAAIVRGAEVHHLLVPNATRGLLRKPGSQHEIAAAKAVFCKNHHGGAIPDTLSAFLDRRLSMLDPQMRLGIVRTKDRRRVERELEAGFRDGLSRQSKHPLIEDQATQPFKPFDRSGHPSSLNIAVETGWDRSTNASLSRFARALVAEGHRVSRFSFQSGWAAPSVAFQDGVWVHRGGTWALPQSGSGPIAIGRRARSAAERHRVAARRKFDVVLRSETGATTSDFIELPGSRRKVSLLFEDQVAGNAGEIRQLLQCVADGLNPKQKGADDSKSASAAHRFATSGVT